MEERYEAIITKSFTENQALADIIAGNRYQVNKEEEYFVSEFGETIYVPIDELNRCFRKIRVSRAANEAKKRYRRRKTFSLYIVLFDDDLDIIEHLKKYNCKKRGYRSGKSDYIRRLIREDMKKTKE